MSQFCPKLTTRLESLKALKKEFDLELTKAQSLSPNKPEDLALVREIKTKLEQDTLRELENKLWLLMPPVSQCVFDDDFWCT
ncbi:MAG: hypothetical protein WCW02_01930 [Candidatus Buchananbacteria bacterium]